MGRIRPYFETKFLPDTIQTSRLKGFLSRLTSPDQHGTNGFYEVLSIYYDTQDLEFLHDKIQGLHDKIKIRLRFYRQNAGMNWSHGGIEVKQRNGQIVTKHRLEVSQEILADGLLMDGDLIKKQIIEKATIPAITTLLSRKFLNPVIAIAYQRQAMNFTGIDGLRFTFDSEISFCRPFTDIISGRTNTENDLSRFSPSNIFEIKSYFPPPESIMQQIDNLGLCQQSHSKFSTLMIRMLEPLQDKRLSV